MSATPATPAQTEAPPKAKAKGTKGYPLADGVDLLTTTQAWRYCQGQGYQGTKDAWRAWAKRNLIPLMVEYGIEPTGYQGRNNAMASYRRVMIPEG